MMSDAFTDTDAFTEALTALLERTTKAPFQVDSLDIVLTPREGHSEGARYRLIPGVRGLQVSGLGTPLTHLDPGGGAFNRAVNALAKWNITTVEQWEQACDDQHLGVIGRPDEILYDIRGYGFVSHQAVRDAVNEWKRQQR